MRQGCLNYFPTVSTNIKKRLKPKANLVGVQLAKLSRASAIENPDQSFEFAGQSSAWFFRQARRVFLPKRRIFLVARAACG
jgi:hypothetical protein